MGTGLIFAIPAIFTLAGLLYAEKREDRRLRWIFKPLTSALFLLTALSDGLDSEYAQTLFLGLVLCFFGDVFLIPDSEKWFLVGLVTFLLGHVTYIITFNRIILFTEVPALAVIVIFSAGVFLWLRPKLGEMQIPVMVYVIVITLMVWSAWTIFFETDAKENFRWLVALGATSFFFSDLAVALDKFVMPGFINRAWGLPLYYLGQFLLAFSIFYI